ncbi:MAG TPA: ComF family protein [Gammaproteobacteria bacterium]|jgi:ComF family protein|nr:ComF family protein [Gammaproteobacteria bacterium]
MVYKWGNRLLDSLFPPVCRLCRAGISGSLPLCAGCRDDLPRLAPGCSQCARPLGGGVGDRRCGRCQRKPPAYDRATALFHYRPPLDYLVKRLKFSGDLGMGPLLAELMRQQLQGRTQALPGLLIPVPLHPHRQRERGYNQALELARPLGRALDIPVDSRLCRRTRPTAAQSLLGTTARRVNMRNAFAVNATAVTAHVAIIDDVMTTGCTADELARVLKRAGASLVEVWVVARAV